MPTVEIDGRRITVEEGLTVIRAAERLGIEIPHYCWHPGLSIAGNCRMCAVEIEKAPKLQIACNTRVTDGMVVHTTSERVKAAQRAVLEFLLLNHPIDCPVCDQSGECKLQEYYMDYDRQRSRIPLPEKVRKGKAIPVGPRVMLDQERCIMCSRCVRFCEEVTRTHDLVFYRRGNHVELNVAPGRTLDNAYSMNVVDICPVGALTSRDFRFRARVWYLERTLSLCTGCANGCNVDLYHRDGRLYRYVPRYNPEVNQYWMCDAGRMTIHALQGEGRLTTPLQRGAEAFARAAWDAALAAAARRLEEIARAGGRLAVVVSAQASNEEIFLARQLAAALGASVAAVAWSPPDADHDALLIKADKNPNTQGLRLQGLEPDGALDAVLGAAARGELGGLVVYRCDLTRWRPAPAVAAALERVAWLVVLDTHLRETAEFADVVLPVATHAESDGTFTNHAGRVQRFARAVHPPGEARAGWDVLGDLVVRLGGTAPRQSAAEVFAALAAECPPLHGVTWERLDPHGVLAGTAPAAAPPR